MRNISMFIFNFNYIKDLARITMDEKCNGIYCEAETDRYKIAENSYNLLMPNDVFNSKTYTIFVFIISIMIFIYYYRMLDLYNYKEGYFVFKIFQINYNLILYILIHALLLTILLWMIIYRYIPNDEQGYNNYFKIKWASQTNSEDNSEDNKNTIRTVVAFFAIVTFIIIGFACISILRGSYSYFKSIFQLYSKIQATTLSVIIVGFLFFIVTLPISIPIILYNYGFNDKIYKISASFDVIYVYLISLIPLFVVLLKNNDINIITLFCFIASIILVIYLMNIVMTFRNNTTPILKTKPLTWSLRNSLNNHLGYRITAKAAVTEGITTEYNKINTCANSLGNNISSVLDIYISFEELSKIVYNSLTIPAYTTKLKDTINKSEIYGASDETYNTPTLSLIFDKKVSIPSDYGDIITQASADAYNEGKPDDLKVDVDTRSIKYPEFSSSHEYNSNDRNTNYLYTADISYDNANLFYEKYWDMKDTDNDFLCRYEYVLPVFLKKILFNVKPNLIKLLLSVVIFIGFAIFAVMFKVIFLNSWNWDWDRDLFSANIKILAPFIAFVVFVSYIILFIRFNTNFNKNVVYKCLDCSYKRSLNKLNTIVTPYIRMYDNKIIGGNKDYKHHYIIANVFYSILSGNINLSAIASSPINENVDGTSYFPISNELKLDFNSINNLNNDNQFREYYKARFKNLYNTKYDDKEVTKIYTVFTNFFGTTSIAKTTELLIDTYFKSDIIKYELILKIYRIIKICIKLFDEKTFNNSNEDNYNNFKFYKKSSKLIPHKFILILRSISDYNTFVSNHETTYINEFNDALKNKLEIIVDADHLKNTTKDMTSILKDINNEDSTNQNPDIQNKNMIKIIAKYLLIMGHMNYNGFKYNKTGTTEENKKDIYTLQTLKLYELISNVSYVDTFDIDDTFYIKITTDQYDKYKKLTYMYNYLDTKYVILSSTNNKNYLLNIIKSINNTLNNDNKTTQPDNFEDIKDARYLFSGKIKEIAPELPYENEDEILNNAYYISTTSFEYTYFINMFIVISYIIGTIVFKIK